MKKIIKFIESLKGELVSTRRKLHKYPELGFEEVRTSQQVVNFLTELGLEVEQKEETGVVGLLDCGQGPTVALRADMDALPISEQTEVSYKSSHQGVMHACGHDGHMAILLETAKVLVEFRDQLSGKVKFIFQPAEEGPGGALPLIEAGVLESVDNIFGLHINNQLTTGVIGVQPKAASAAADELDLIIKGDSGHASTPHQGVDAIVIASQVITALQNIISRQVNPHQAAVINIGTIKGGYRRNVIADKVKLTGTVRTTEPNLREFMPERIEQIVEGITINQGASYELDYNFGYPVLINSSSLVDELSTVIESIPYVEELRYLSQSSLGAEDFAYYLEQVPGVFFRLGAAKPSEDYYSAHHPKFNFDEEALKIGVALFVYLVFYKLS
ncbi:amidohydrolase [Halobacteroides halobius DSM 5150]|uniref:Amidohydrolase n=1 Tax=Halobacteroides halobius (strain ATCC 35273 / DSM 5150 / MD-1) TaxID=748449 RepID=L0K882_HALHC|nr:amidohydrolase [Halobacteroides halobius]AGB40303.1 amidohydrolase [Halobacteroides halobius DSM 5150]